MTIDLEPLALATAVLVLMRWFGAIDWPWSAVTAPLWGVLLAGMAIAIWRGCWRD